MKLHASSFFSTLTLSNIKTCWMSKTLQSAWRWTADDLLTEAVLLLLVSLWRGEASSSAAFNRYLGTCWGTRMKNKKRWTLASATEITPEDVTGWCLSYVIFTWMCACFVILSFRLSVSYIFQVPVDKFRGCLTVESAFSWCHTDKDLLWFPHTTS